MKDLNFSNELENGHKLSYKKRKTVPIFFTDEIPFFMKSGEFEDTEMFSYSDDTQFVKADGAIQPLTVNKLKEVMNKVGVPIKIRMGGVNYLAAKGFLAHYTGEDKIIPIVVAMTSGKKEIVFPEDVKIYICRASLGNDRYKAIKPMILDLIENYEGDVILAKDISRFFGAKIQLPEFKTLGERKKYLEGLIEEGIEHMRKERGIK